MRSIKLSKERLKVLLKDADKMASVDPKTIKDLVELSLECLEFKEHHKKAGCPTGHHCRWECPGDHGK